VQRRMRMRTALGPQVSEHADHSVHLVKPPLTTTIKQHQIVNYKKQNVSSKIANLPLPYPVLTLASC